ncbi:symporter [Nocardioides psychrotolerans]|uniref:Bile acid:Na+ symporter, BASS family n=1 Tax=Nocardioides psychrotolerans TaxID=1005945 RepID=A0A1I3E3E0_9ACTN|nr:bile acid:sodium symporter family protein [Nocardioides psychrotolerans]GEP37527.1 symporter [Nocardioides psychrotolerans]SFH93494.1 bile acid:Na+ symporter, BASS family [Nocardioides psychrotolerans]
MTLHCQLVQLVDIDQLSLELPQSFQLAVKIVVGLFLFGVALDTRAEDLRDVVRRPWVMAIGLAAQYAVAPGLALLLTLALGVRGSIAIGMLLVACCPAGNLSNLLTHRARGDVALSISLTGLSNLLAVVLTPLSFAFWSGLNPAAADLLRDVSIDPWTLMVEVALLIGLPFALGMFAAWRWPAMAARARKVVEPGTLVLLLFVVVGGAAAQMDVLVNYLGLVAVPIVAHNALALGVGYVTGRACRLPSAGVRAMTFELGVRNTALGVVLALAFFSDLGGVVFVAALWGLWDVATGLALASWWRRRTVRPAEPAAVG